MKHYQKLLFLEYIKDYSKKKKNSFYIALNVLLCFLLNQGLKHIFLRTRPEDINFLNDFAYIKYQVRLWLKLM